MNNKIVFIHTIPALINEFNALGAKQFPQLQLIHLVDEMLLEHMALNQGEVDPALRERLASHILYAEQVRADAVLVTCSVFTNTIDEIRPDFQVPIIKIDEKMVKRAVQSGASIGLLVTNPDAVTLSQQLLLDEAEHVGRSITVRPSLVDHAFAAVRKGDRETHDHLVREAILKMSSTVDVIVLAQASMAGVIDTLSEDERIIPILSSPQLALEQASTAGRFID